MDIDPQAFAPLFRLLHTSGDMVSNIDDYFIYLLSSSQSSIKIIVNVSFK